MNLVMFRMVLKGAFFFLFLQCYPHFMQAGHLEQSDDASSLITRYYLTDMGKAEIDFSCLSKTAGKFFLSPEINNQSQGIANTSSGGYTFIPSKWQHPLQITDILINAHAINQNGDILVSLKRGNESVEWMIWLADSVFCAQSLRESRMCKASRKHIETVDSFNPDFFITGFNCTKTVVGYRKENEKNHPFLWTPARGFSPLGMDQGTHIDGIPKAINDQGAIAGIMDETNDKFPFLLSECGRVDMMKGYRYSLKPSGWTEFADMVLAQDNTIYGTFWIRYGTEGNSPRKYNPYYAYKWTPQDGKIEMLDLFGMRISDVNHLHELVGSLDGRAVICKPKQMPISLLALTDPKQSEDWELLEATSINDKGEIAGYGNYKGECHLFFASPVR